MNINEVMKTLRAPFFERDEAISRPDMLELCFTVSFLEYYEQSRLFDMFQPMEDVNTAQSHVYFEGIKPNCELKGYRPIRTINDKRWRGVIGALSSEE